MSGAARRETIGSAELWLGDCRELLPELRARRPAAVVSDPPYGMRLRRGRSTARKGLEGGAVRSVGTAGIIGDDEPFDPAPWLGGTCLLWGANYFRARLPEGGAWLVWDKVEHGGAGDFSQAEIAWCSAKGATKMFRHMWMGVQRASEVGQRRQHPTQKPVALMTWCLEQARVPAGGLVCDPYMGSGTTGVAAVRNGFPFLGCEIDPAHFDTACRRIEEAQAAGPLFAAPPPAKARAPETADLFGGAS